MCVGFILWIFFSVYLKGVKLRLKNSSTHFKVVRLASVIMKGVTVR